VNSLVCENCKRKLVDRYFDKCMYCGHSIPENHRLSKGEKDLVKSKKEQQTEEQMKEHEQYMARHKKFFRRRGGNDGGVDIDGGDSGEGGGDGGDGGGD
jgi:hypothetical protein